jgi:hypothetical protein
VETVIDLLAQRARKHMYRQPASMVDGGIMVTTLLVAANVVVIEAMSRANPATWREALALSNFEAPHDDTMLVDTMVGEITRCLRSELGRKYYTSSLGDNYVDLVELELARLTHSQEILAAGPAALLVTNFTATTQPGKPVYPAEAYNSCVAAWIAAAKEAGIEAIHVGRPDRAWRDEGSWTAPYRSEEPCYAYVAGLAGVVQVEGQQLVIVVTNASGRHHVIQVRALAEGHEQKLFKPIS